MLPLPPPPGLASADVRSKVMVMLFDDYLYIFCSKCFIVVLCLVLVSICNT